MNVDTIHNYSQQLDALIAEYETIDKESSSVFAKFYIKFVPVYEFAMPLLNNAQTLKKVGEAIEAIARSRNEEFNPAEKVLGDATYDLATRVNAFADRLETHANHFRSPAPLSGKTVTKKKTASPAPEPGVSFMKKGWLNQPQVQKKRDNEDKGKG